MAHQSWYRKYRPQTFDDVVGQAHVERTIRNAVDEGVFAHAYLFAGPRGTGKTTTARLLAKALNCQAGPTGQPDDTCEDCREIADGTHPDVYELDAASRTGVDAVREEIIGRVNFAPARGRYKVYIIDEVHMLSSSAFNALLKTLEEPPAHVVFVLCTTHPHKVPETIHSRCQTFEFRRLSVDEIAARLRHIADAEGVEVEDAVLTLVARHARGGMRDAITALEQLASFVTGPITLADAEGLLGAVGSEELFEVVDFLIASDLGALFGAVAALVERGTDLAEFSLALARHARDLLVVKVLDDPGPALDVRAEDLGRLRRQANELGHARIVRMLDVLDDLGSTMRQTADVRLALEVALTRLAKPEADVTVEALVQRIEALEDALRGGAPMQPSPSKQHGAAPREGEKRPRAPRSAAAASADPEAVQAAAPAADAEPAAATTQAGAGPLDRKAVKRSWPAVIAEMRKRKPARSHHFDATEVEVVGDALVVEFPRDRGFSMEYAREPETLALLKSTLEKVLGVSPPIEYRLGRDGVSAPASTPAEQGPSEAAELAVDAHPDGAGPVQEAASDVDELEARLVAELGASLVEERPLSGDDGPKAKKGRT
ncbi:MAG: DNA polymerase III subunit gamma/tau [Coriobacteriia bacterium]|nr:DNA polymerase III subunit gamma/tau [Coriobacteriia bacterium]